MLAAQMREEMQEEAIRDHDIGSVGSELLKGGPYEL